MSFKNMGFVLGMLAVPGVVAAEVSFSPSVSLGYKTITFGAGSIFEKEEDTSMPVIGMAVVASIDKFAVQGSYELAISEGDISSTSGEPIFFDDATSEKYSGDVDRSDAAISVSYAVLDQLSVFGGYIINKTEIGDLEADGFDAFGDESDLSQLVQVEGDYTQTDRGFIAGIRIIPLTTAMGSLSATLGYAVLDTETEFDVSASGPGGVAELTGSDDDGDTKGVSLGAAWVGPVPGVQNLRYIASARVNRFTYKEEGEEADNDLAYVGGGLMFSL